MSEGMLRQARTFQPSGQIQKPCTWSCRCCCCWIALGASAAHPPLTLLEAPWLAWQGRWERGTCMHACVRVRMQCVCVCKSVCVCKCVCVCVCVHL